MTLTKRQYLVRFKDGEGNVLGTKVITATYSAQASLQVQYMSDKPAGTKKFSVSPIPRWDCRRGA